MGTVDRYGCRHVFRIINIGEDEIVEDVYNKEYLPSIVRVGRVVLLASTLFFFVPFLYTWIAWGISPDWPAILKGSFAWLLINLPWWVSEPIAYFPVQGITGMLLCSLAGNASNMRMPCAITAQKAAGVSPGTQKGSLISTIAISITCFVSIGILAVAVLAGQAVLSRLPASVSDGLSLLLPALFGCIFAQFLAGNERNGAFSIILAIGVLLLYKKGFLSAIPADGGSIIVMLAPIIGTMAFAYAMAKKKGKQPETEEEKN